MKSPHIVVLMIFLLAGSSRAESIPLWTAGSGGIHRTTLDLETGKLTVPQLEQDIAAGSWLVKHPALPLLYASIQGAGSTGVAVFRYDQDGHLEAWEQVELPSGSPTCIAIDPMGRTLATAHYGQGTTGLVRLRPDGGFSDEAPFTLKMPFRGEGPHSVQSQSRPHWVGFSADGTRLHVPDLGNDIVWSLAVDAEALTLEAANQAELPRGSRPRHFARHPTLPFAYVNGELGSIVAQLRLASGPEYFTLVDHWPTLSGEDDEPYNNTSEVRVHPSGKFLYVGNRGNDSIAVFAIDPVIGSLTPVEREAVRGSWPRNFNIDPSGRWLVVAGQYSNTLASFAIDQATGALSYTRSIVSVPGPVRVLFVR